MFLYLDKLSIAHEMETWYWQPPECTSGFDDDYIWLYNKTILQGACRPQSHNIVMVGGTNPSKNSFQAQPMQKKTQICEFDIRNLATNLT